MFMPSSQYKDGQMEGWDPYLISMFHVQTCIKWNLLSSNKEGSLLPARVSSCQPASEFC